MKAFSFLYRGQVYAMRSELPTDLSIPIINSGGPEAYNLPKPVFTPFKAGAFVGSIAQGGSLNCEQIAFYPHGSGTHTESLLHVSNEGMPPYQIPIPLIMPAYLVSVQPNNGCIDTLPSALWEHQVQALIVRTLPNNENKKQAVYSQQNPPYFDPVLMNKLAHHGILHLLTDLPSVDPEVDEGKLLAHKAFFNKRKHATITELIFVPNAIPDGLYALNLQLPAIETDAVPSRPLIYSLLESET